MDDAYEPPPLADACCPHELTSARTWAEAYNLAHEARRNRQIFFCGCRRSQCQQKIYEAFPKFTVWTTRTIHRSNRPRLPTRVAPTSSRRLSALRRPTGWRKKSLDTRVATHCRPRGAATRRVCSQVNILEYAPRYLVKAVGLCAGPLNLSPKLNGIGPG